MFVDTSTNMLCANFKAKTCLIIIYKLCSTDCKIITQNILYMRMLCFTVMTPTQQVQFILGQEDKEGEVSHEPHQIFCELEELRSVGDEGVLEWKETGR